MRTATATAPRITPVFETHARPINFVTRGRKHGLLIIHFALVANRKDHDLIRR